MYHYLVRVPGDLNIRLLHHYPVFDNASAHLWARNFLPGVSVSTETAARYDCTLTVKHSTKPKLTRSGSRITLEDEWRGHGSLFDLLHLLYSIARVRWLRSNLYPVHSACIGVPGEHHTLIVGHSGVGKTSMALHAAAELPNKKIFSANKTLISMGDNLAMTAIAGTPTITRTRENSPPSKIRAHLGRVAAPLESSLMSSESQVEIGTIVIGRLNDGYDRCELLSAPLAPKESALHKLYPFFMDTVNADTILCGGAKVFSGRAHRGCEEQLATTLWNVLQHMHVYQISGSMKFVTDKLADL